MQDECELMYLFGILAYPMTCRKSVTYVSIWCPSITYDMQDEILRSVMPWSVNGKAFFDRRSKTLIVKSLLQISIHSIEGRAIFYRMFWNLRDVSFIKCLHTFKSDLSLYDAGEIETFINNLRSLELTRRKRKVTLSNQLYRQRQLMQDWHLLTINMDQK